MTFGPKPLCNCVFVKPKVQSKQMICLVQYSKLYVGGIGCWWNRLSGC